MADDTSGDAYGGITTSDITTDDVDWNAVRHDFLYSGMAQRRIAWRYGITEDKLRRQRNAEGWERIAPVVPLPTRRTAGPRDGEPPTPTQKRRGRLGKRLFAVLDAKLNELEARMSEVSGEGPPRSAADAERDARTLGALARLYAKLVELDEAKQARMSAKQTQTRSLTKDGDNADRLRRDLAGRLARLGPGNA